MSFHFRSQLKLCYNNYDKYFKEFRRTGHQVQDKIKIGDKEYDLTNMDEKVRKYLTSLSMYIVSYRGLRNMKVILNRAKNGYIEDIKYEIIKNKTGIDVKNFAI